jgi:predicted phage-related endonuclease
MTPSDIEAILQDHLAGVHDELGQLFRGIEKSLNNHLAKTEAAISKALQEQDTENAARFAQIEKRLADLEARH